MPSLLIRREAWEVSQNNNALYQLIEQNPITPITYQMNGTTHFDFGMGYMFTRLAPLIGLQGERGLEMPLTQNAMVLDFMNALLNTSQSFTLDLSEYEDLIPIILP